jgi:prepilin-type N-terminal cleavage/methylation domain-containing protein
MIKKFKYSAGFTLIELAVVITIVALLIGGMAIPLGTRIAEQRHVETKEKLNKAVEALIGFAVLNRRLPCPDIALGLATDRDGIENTVIPAVGNNNAGLVSNCAIGINAASPNSELALNNGTFVSWGDLPWATLGLVSSDSADAWNNRLRYAVYHPLATQVAMPPTNTNIGLANLNNANIIISCHNRNIGATAAPGCPAASPYDIANNAVFVIYSHGVNGYGATGLANTNPIGFPAGFVANHDERGNSPNAELTPALRNQFIARIRTDAGGNLDEFDDMVVWVSRNVLAAKLLAAGAWPP